MDLAVNVTGQVTLNKSELEDQQAAGEVPDHLMADVDAGLRQVLDL